MRFRTHDLLMATLLAACYAAMAGAGLFGTIEGVASNAGYGAAVVLMGSLTAFAANRPVREVGDLVCKLRANISWASHFAMLAAPLFSGILSCFASENVSRSASNMVFFIWLNVYFIVLLGRVALYEDGLVTNGIPASFDDYFFRVVPDGDGYRLAMKEKEGFLWRRSSRGPWIPNDRVDDVRAFLAEKQPSAKEHA